MINQIFTRFKEGMSKYEPSQFSRIDDDGELSSLIVMPSSISLYPSLHVDTVIFQSSFT